MAKIIGITGPSGSGKSVLCSYLRKEGIPCIDADSVYHSMLIPPSECLDALRLAFGDSVFTPSGELDRRELSKTVFSSSEQLDKLNATVLPIVLKRIREIISEYTAAGHKIVAVDAPTLIESGFVDECHLVAVVIASRETRILRASQRDGISFADAERRISAQHSDDYYKQVADFVLCNNGDLSEFETQVKELIKTISNIII